MTTPTLDFVRCRRQGEQASRVGRPGERLDADAAQPAGRGLAARLGHAHRAHRHPAPVRRRSAPRPAAQRVAARVGVLRRPRRHRPPAEQHRHGADRRRVRRTRADRHRACARGDARRRRRHVARRPVLSLRPVVARAVPDLHRRGAVPVAAGDQRRALRPHPDRARPHHVRAAVDLGRGASPSCRPPASR